MRTLLCLLTISFTAACSADQFVEPGTDAGGTDSAADVSVLDVATLDAPISIEGGGDDGGNLPPQLVTGIPPSVDLYAVWGLSPLDFWVVGLDHANSNAGFVGHWTGSAFVKTSGVDPVPLRGVWGTPDGVFFVGDKDTGTTSATAIYQAKGGPIAPLVSGSLMNKALVSVWFDEAADEYVLQASSGFAAHSSTPFTSASDISGSQIPGPCAAMHARYAACTGGVFPLGTGTALAPSVSSGPQLRAIHVSNAVVPLYFVAGAGGLLVRAAGAAWTSVTNTGTQDLLGVWSNAAGDGAIAVGKHGTILAIAGTTNPFAVAFQSPNNEDLNAVTAVGQGASRIFVAVGNNGTVVTKKF